jgi:hypothetical protein
MTQSALLDLFASIHVSVASDPEFFATRKAKNKLVLVQCASVSEATLALVRLHNTDVGSGKLKVTYNRRPLCSQKSQNTTPDTRPRSISDVPYGIVDSEGMTAGEGCYNESVGSNALGVSGSFNNHNYFENDACNNNDSGIDNRFSNRPPAILPHAQFSQSLRRTKLY